MTESERCYACGRGLPVSAKFCPHCGEHLTPENRAVYAYAALVQRLRRSERRRGDMLHRKWLNGRAEGFFERIAKVAGALATPR